MSEDRSRFGELIHTARAGSAIALILVVMVRRFSARTNARAFMLAAELESDACSDIGEQYWKAENGGVCS